MQVQLEGVRRGTRGHRGDTSVESGCGTPVTSAHHAHHSYRSICSRGNEMRQSADERTKVIENLAEKPRASSKTLDASQLVLE